MPAGVLSLPHFRQRLAKSTFPHRRVRILALTMCEQAIAGDLSASKEIADRVEGRVAQRQEFCGPDGGAIPWLYTSREENEKRLAELCARAGLEN